MQPVSDKTEPQVGFMEKREWGRGVAVYDRTVAAKEQAELDLVKLEGAFRFAMVFCHSGTSNIRSVLWLGCADDLLLAGCPDYLNPFVILLFANFWRRWIVDMGDHKDYLRGMLLT